MSATTTAAVRPDARPDVARLEDMYRLMRTADVADGRVRQEAKAGRLQAAFYPIHGLEAVCAALSVALHDGDHVVSTYRNLGDLLARGVPLRSILAELYARVDGTSRGKGGPMHLQDHQIGMMATTGVVGSGLPIAVGLGVAAQMDDDGRAVVVTFGDGATSIGAFHEAMNIAALWKLPVVFLCQNNGWGEHTPIEEYAANTDLARRARAYGMHGVRVDGFDPMATWRTLDGALDAARSGDGPVFVEAVTYRLVGHTSSADYSYMPEDRLQEALARDPAPTFRGWLLAEELIGEARLTELDAEVEQLVEDAFAFAEASEEPGPDELYRDVFADEAWAVGR